MNNELLNKRVNASRPLLLGVIIAIAVMLLIAQQIVSPESKTRLQEALVDSMHTPWFFVLYLLFWLFLRLVFRFSQRQTLIISTVASIILALTTEGLQLLTSRDASLIDFVRDLLGAASAFLMIQAWLYWTKTKKMLSLSLVMAGGILFAAGFSGVAFSLWMNHQRALIAPHLIDFEQDVLNRVVFYSEIWQPVESQLDWPGYENRQVGKIEVSGTVEYPGIWLQQPYPDWRDYKVLVIESFIDGDYSIPFTLRVETLGNRGMQATQALTMSPGVNHWQLPIPDLIQDQPAGFKEILQLYLFTAPEHAGKTFYLGDIYLSDN